MKYVYPAIFTQEDRGISVRFPNFENCYTSGETVIEAIEMAEDVLCLTLCDREESGAVISKPIPIKSLATAKNEFASYVVCDTAKYQSLYENDVKVYKESCFSHYPLKAIKQISLTEVLTASQSFHAGLTSNCSTRIKENNLLAPVSIHVMSVNHPERKTPRNRSKKQKPLNFKDRSSKVLDGVSSTVFDYSSKSIEDELRTKQNALAICEDVDIAREACVVRYSATDIETLRDKFEIPPLETHLCRPSKTFEYNYNLMPRPARNKPSPPTTSSTLNMLRQSLSKTSGKSKDPLDAVLATIQESFSPDDCDYPSILVDAINEFEQIPQLPQSDIPDTEEPL